LRVGALNETNAVTIYNKNGAGKEFNGWFLERYEDAYLYEKQEFVDCILQKRKPEATVYDATKATQVSFAAKESLLTKKIVEIENS
jgi:myo-inositol 2-dehydrogenase/D-chiro-inositol 1-dehydrogenase